MSGTSSNSLDKKGKRGSTNNTSRLAAFGGAIEKQRGNADWGRADPRWIAAVVVAASAANMEAAFALTKDGGAHGLKLFDYGSGERVQLWFNGDADLDAELEQVWQKLSQ